MFFRMSSLFLPLSNNLSNFQSKTLSKSSCESSVSSSFSFDILSIAAYPVRGLDINSSYLIYSLLNEQKKKNTAVLFIGEDLDVLLELCDRIMVLCHGKITGICDAKTVTKEQVGMMMTGSTMEEVLGIG